jgi:hypothetical protein
MKVELLVIEQIPSGLQGVTLHTLEGTPKSVAQAIAEFHGEMQAAVNEGVIARYSVLTEFDDSGVVK